MPIFIFVGVYGTTLMWGVPKTKSVAMAMGCGL